MFGQKLCPCEYMNHVLLYLSQNEFCYRVCYAQELNLHEPSEPYKNPLFSLFCSESVPYNWGFLALDCRIMKEPSWRTA